MFSSISTHFCSPLTDQNRSLAPDFTITQRILDERIREWVKQYNYTLNPDGVYEAIRYMYTYWPDRYNRTWIRQMYVDVSTRFFILVTLLGVHCRKMVLLGLLCKFENRREFCLLCLWG